MRLVKNDRNFLVWSALSLLALLLAENNNFVKAYPMRLEVDVDDQRCLRLNIPEEDDAHMVFFVYPALGNDGQEGSPPSLIKNYDKLEGHFFGQMQELTQKRTTGSGLLRKFPVKPPTEVQSAMDDFLRDFQGNMKTPLKVKITNPKSTFSREFETFWFTPLVINHLRRAIRTPKKDRESTPLEGYEACFENNHEEEELMHVVVDSVLLSEGPEYDDDENGSEDPTFQGHHLTPLAEQLSESIQSAQTVIREMQYMERREARMRHTADSINSRVKYFSYISVGILLVVTYVQVTYLKRYFKKKKLL